MGIREQAKRIGRPGWTVVAATTGVATVALAGFALAGAEDRGDVPDDIQLRDAKEITYQLEETPTSVPVVPAPITDLNGSSYDSPLDYDTAVESVASVASADGWDASAASVASVATADDGSASIASVASAASWDSPDSPDSPDASA